MLVSWVHMKLSEKFARQESEPMRLARIARRRISQDRAGAIRQLFGIEKEAEATAPTVVELPYVCGLCRRRFSLPMHLGRHTKSKHRASAAEEGPNADVVGRSNDGSSSEALGPAESVWADGRRPRPRPP